MFSSYVLNIYATRHSLSANTLFIFPSIDKVHIYPIIATQSCQTTRGKHCYKRSQRIMVQRRISDVSPVATSVDVWRFVNNNHTFVTKMH
jgi:hypothetical protein